MFFHENVLKLWKQHSHWNRIDWTRTVLWAAYVYRRVNRVETFIGIGRLMGYSSAGFIPLLSELDVYLKMVGKYRDSIRGTKTNFFTGAHQAPSMENYQKDLRKLAESDGYAIREKAWKLESASTTEECLKALEEWDGVGKFYPGRFFAI